MRITARDFQGIFNLLIFIFYVLMLSGCSRYMEAERQTYEKGKNFPVVGYLLEPIMDLRLTTLEAMLGPNFEAAVKQVAKQLVEEIDDLEFKSNSKKRDSFYIFNRSISDGRERKIDSKFIDGLIEFLSKSGIRIKRKNNTSFREAANAAKYRRPVVCDDFLDQTAPNFLIEYSLSECPEKSECAKAHVQVVREGTNDILYTTSATFTLTDNLFKLYHSFVKIPPPIGERDNPYQDYYEAARYMVRRLCCLARKKMHNTDRLGIAIGKTERTPPNIAMAFSAELTACGLRQVISKDNKMLPVMLGFRKYFELPLYKKEYRENFAAADIVLAVDAVEDNSEIIHFTSQILTLKSVQIKNDKNMERLSAGMVIPECAVQGFSQN